MWAARPVQRSASGRDVGRIPARCAANEDNHAGLCYNKCRRGYKGAVTLCVPNCPRGYRDDGLYCFKPAPYGRGAGYPWKFGDKAFSLDGARARCKRANRQGCEKSGQIIYPRCKAGYKAFGCCECSPKCPSYTIDIGISCQKKTYDRGIGRLRKCGPGKRRDAGLCYPFCKRGFNGVGPVCWSNQCPAKYPVSCGAACAVSTAACVEGVTNQVMRRWMWWSILPGWC